MRKGLPSTTRLGSPVAGSFPTRIAWSRYAGSMNRSNKSSGSAKWLSPSMTFIRSLLFSLAAPDFPPHDVLCCLGPLLLHVAELLSQNGHHLGGKQFHVFHGTVIGHITKLQQR